MTQFEFEAQNAAGNAFRGSLDAQTIDNAHHQLHALGLTVLSVHPVANPVKRIRMGMVDLETFNEHLLNIASAKLPLERGLELLAGDLRRGKLKSALQSLSADLQSGQSLEQSIGARQGDFPPIYANLLDAGVRTGNLVGVLQGFGHHLQRMSRMRDELWRACAYPLVVLMAFGFLLIFLSYWVLPSYFDLLHSLWASKGNSFRRRQEIPFDLPLMATVLYWAGWVMPYLLGGLVAMVLAIAGTWAVLKPLGRERKWIDAVVLRLPLVGRAIRHSYVARWVDAVAISVRAGMDLPAALKMAGQVVALPSFERDSKQLVDLIERGGSLDSAPKLNCLPASLAPAMALGSESGNLPEVLGTLARQYADQAERRIKLIPAVVVPILIACIGVTAGTIVYTLWVPMTRFLQWMTSGWYY